jgi:hypothetical protein
MQRKLNVEIAMGTMSMMKQVVNETGAYVLQQGQRKFEGAELAEMKIVRSYSMKLLATKGRNTLLVSRPLTVKILTPLKTVKQRSIMM